MSQTLREEIQKEYRDVVERRVFTGLLSRTLKILNIVFIIAVQLYYSLIIYSFLQISNRTVTGERADEEVREYK